MSRYYAKDGTPITFDEWCKSTTDETKRVALTELPGKGRVSTVWLGLNHQYGDGPPLIFETMVFPEGSWSEDDCDRYSTLAEAEAGHARMVEKWRAK